MSTSRRELLRWTALAAAGTVLASCSANKDSVAGQARAGDRKGYVSGDGSIEQLPVSARGAPVDLRGTTLEGEPWSIAEAEGKILVLNVWGSWCPPCIKEAPDLQKAWETVQTKKLPVQFLGLDKQESPESGLAFQRGYKITYPSLAYDGGLPILALQSKAIATPTTLILDRQHRIAARVSGTVTTGTLLGLIDDAIAEMPPQ